MIFSDFFEPDVLPFSHLGLGPTFPRFFTPKDFTELQLIRLSCLWCLLNLAHFGASPEAKGMKFSFAPIFSLFKLVIGIFALLFY